MGPVRVAEVESTRGDAVSGTLQGSSTLARLLLRVGGRAVLTISKPLSAGQAQRYHQEEFANARENYYTADETIRGE